MIEISVVCSRCKEKRVFQFEYFGDAHNWMNDRWGMGKPLLCGKCVVEYHELRHVVKAEGIEKLEKFERGEI